MHPSDTHFSRTGSVAAVCGVLVYAASAVLHPWTPPHETEAAFAHYAAEPAWAFIHIAELLGILAMTAAALALAWRLRRGVAGVWAALATAAMLVFAGVYAIFIAVDGVALGIMVQRWQAAAVERQELLFETAFAVRQIEAGLFGMQWFMFGLAVGLFAVAFLASAPRPFRLNWLNGMGLLSAIASAGTLAFGVVQARTGFSEFSMAFQTGLYTGFVWIIAVAVFLFRSPTPADDESGSVIRAATEQEVPGVRRGP